MALKGEVDRDAEEDNGEAREGVAGLSYEGEDEDDGGCGDEEGGEDGVSPDAVGAGCCGERAVAAAEDEDGDWR